MPRKQVLVGIIGKLNSGKSTVAKTFEAAKFKPRSFADPLKQILQDLFDIPEDTLWGPSENRTGEVRQMLQELGTDFARKFRPNIWIDKMEVYLKQHPYTNVIIPDVRFHNEAELIHTRGGFLIQVERPSNGSHETIKANEHRSETEQETIPAQLIYQKILNSGTLEDLTAMAEITLGDILNASPRK